tara:strand:+ start:872 stop:1288 length:417 start_codon:yes stop_codon:yes gene_type:complete
MSVNIEKLENILENDNHTILNKTYTTIKSDKNDILQKLNVTREKLKDITYKLKNYRYIDEISDIVSGNYCRWINLNNEEIKLQNGGFIGSINISENGPLLCIKTFQKFININANNILLFQKINDEEKILMQVMKYIEK